MSGGTLNKSTMNLKVVRTDYKGKPYYPNVNISYGCSAGEFYSAIMSFDTFASNIVSVTRNIYDSNNTLINSTDNTTTIAKY